MTGKKVRKEEEKVPMNIHVKPDFKEVCMKGGKAGKKQHL